MSTGLQRIILISTFMTCASIYAYDSAPAPWSNVPASVANNVLYRPIADPAVRNIAIQDSLEPLVDLRAVNHPRIRPFAEIDANYQAPYEGFSLIREGVYDKLVAMLDFLPPHIGIAYSEGFRPLYKQKEYFDNKLRETLLSVSDLEKAYWETAKLVSPFIDNVPTHCTGAAIDMSLFRINSEGAIYRLQAPRVQLLDMGKFDVISGVNNQQETFSTETTAVQRANRLLLLSAATQAGFVSYGYEWWHFSYGDKAWAYVKSEDHARYGLADHSPLTTLTREEYLESFLGDKHPEL